MAMQISVALQTFTRFKAIPRAEMCKDLPVLIRITAPSPPHQEGWRPNLDLVVMINYGPGSMWSRTPGLVEQGLVSMIDQLGPRDRLCFLDKERDPMNLTEMYENGRDIAKKWVKAMDNPSCDLSELEEASKVLLKHEENRSNNCECCIILVTHGAFELPETTSKIEFPVHIFSLTDRSDISLGNITEKTSITVYNLTAIKKFKSMITQCISELKSVIRRGIQIHMKAHEGVNISSIESGGYGSRISPEKDTGIIEIDYLCCGEEKNFIVHLVVSEGTKELITVDSNCDDSNDNIQLRQTGVFVQRPDSSIKEICPHVAAEITRLGLVKCVSDLEHGRPSKTLARSWKEIRDSDDGHNASESCLLDLGKDINLIETDLMYRELWLTHHKWQRASTKALLSSRDAFLDIRCVYSWDAQHMLQKVNSSMINAFSENSPEINTTHTAKNRQNNFLAFWKRSRSTRGSSSRGNSSS